MPKLTDFGLARIAGRRAPDANRRRAGHPMLYGPRAGGRSHGRHSADRRCLRSGRAVVRVADRATTFLGATNFETMRQVVTDWPMKPSLLQPAVPRTLERICLKCLEKKPKDRYPTAQALVDDLSEFLEESHPSVRSTGLAECVAGVVAAWRPQGPRRGAGMADPALAIDDDRALVGRCCRNGHRWLFHRHRARASWRPGGCGAARVPVAPIKVGVLHR